MASRKNPLAYVAPLEVIAAGDCGRSEAEAAQIAAVAASEAAAEEEAAEARAAATAAAEAEKSLADSTQAALTSALQPAEEPAAEPSVTDDSGAPTICNHYVKWVRGSALPEDELHGSAQHKAAEVTALPRALKPSPRLPTCRRCQLVASADLLNLETRALTDRVRPCAFRAHVLCSAAREDVRQAVCPQEHGRLDRLPRRGRGGG